MIAAIIQPSYIPWRGYFEQIRRADIFVFYDDVQYDKNGWRNRNQIKTHQGKIWLTIPVHSQGVTEGIPIKDVRIDWTKHWSEKHLKALKNSYSKAPFFHRYLPLLNNFYERRDEFLVDLTVDYTNALAKEIGITKTKFFRSSELTAITGTKTDRLIQILQQIGADYYISGPSAKTYIDNKKFMDAGISLEYMQYNFSEYPQLHPPYDPQVTILDLLFMVGDDALSYIVSPDVTYP
jgi:hypothetical protein